MDIKKNQEVELEITGMTHDGNGVGKLSGMAVFIPGCAQGDIAVVRIIAVKKSFAYGKLIRIVKPSEARVSNDCPVFMKCGGCSFRHIGYDDELHIKYNRVKDALTKIAHLTIVPEPILGSPKINGYRNKAQYPVGMEGDTNKIGFYAPHSHRIIEARDCLLQPPVYKEIINAFSEWMKQAGVTIYDEKTGKGLLRHIYIRQAESTGELMACAVINAKVLPAQVLLIDLLQKADDNIKSIVFNINTENTNVILGKKCVTIWGNDNITDRFAGKKIEISPQSFYQVNKLQAERLYQTAADYLQNRPGDLLLDLYCGAGTIGIFMSGMVKQVIGVEVVAEAVEDARRNAAMNGIENIEFICADAEMAAGNMALRGLKPDSIVVDPPRKGLSSGTIDAILKMNPQKIVYVSCDPATLARDIAIIVQKSDYQCKRVKPLDMFPRTAHVETVCLLER